MMDEKKRKKKEDEVDTINGEGSKRHKTASEQARTNDDGQHEGKNGAPVNGNASADILVPQQNRKKDELGEEGIDQDDGYTVKKGNLVKDGIIVATGEMFTDDGRNSREDSQIGRVDTKSLASEVCCRTTYQPSS